jgi:hypothetical protein
MTIITLGCGCTYNQSAKRYVKYCSTHLNDVIADNVNRQRQLNTEIAQQQALRRQESSTGGIHFKPIFGRPKKYRLKPLFS